MTKEEIKIVSFSTNILLETKLWLLIEYQGNFGICSQVHRRKGWATYRSEKDNKTRFLIFMGSGKSKVA
ncbi:MAG: hypothetical protein A2156_05860 [Deltaproteobacteria bacterium RBG_16_48_10]|nr:MAG: hypothetical protein A2156_05860 [Deltaproteobacteria bacterium RBG_16_48_10]